MKRSQHPALAAESQAAIAQYETYLRAIEDLDPKTIRGYLSDLHHFAAWCEASWEDEQQSSCPFVPAAMTTPLLTRYRSYLQAVLHLKPARTLAGSHCAGTNGSASAIRSNRSGVDAVRSFNAYSLKNVSFAVAPT